MAVCRMSEGTIVIGFNQRLGSPLVLECAPARSFVFVMAQAKSVVSLGGEGGAVHAYERATNAMRLTRVATRRRSAARSRITSTTF